MWALCRLAWWVLVDLFRPRAKLEAEILALRQQINVLRRTAPKRLLLSSIDRLIFVGLYRLFPDVRGALTIVKPDTVIRWHRAGFRAYWRWKSRTRGGRPKVPPEIRQLIRDMSRANPLWGAPRIHGELLKLGIDVGQTSVAKYMARRSRPPSQGWTGEVFTWRVRAMVSLSKIRSGRIGDAIRPRLVGTECARRPGQRAVSAHPCSVISVHAPR